MQAELLEQLGQYSVQLIKIGELVQRQPPQPHLQVMRQKISLKVAQLRTAGQQLAAKQLTPAVVAQMAAFFKESFGSVIKEAHRMVQVRPTQDGQQRLSGKISVIRQMEEEMGSVWESGDAREGECSLLKKLDGNLSTLAQQLDSGQLRSVAKEYLQKEFLAIRVIAYRLYEQYVAHSHPAHRQTLQDIKQEQESLRGQLQDLREVNRELKSEEKRMVRELNELKKVNDMIGKRYFVQEGKEQPQKA